jgi:hypothetical protein
VCQSAGGGLDSLLVLSIAFVLAFVLSLAFYGPSQAYADEFPQENQTTTESDTLTLPDVAQEGEPQPQSDISFDEELDPSLVPDPEDTAISEEIDGLLDEDPLTEITLEEDETLSDPADSAATTLSINGFARGAGTADDPYIVSTPEELDAVRTQPSSNFLMDNDINLTTYLSEGNPGYNDGRGWLPIGDTYSTSFKGTFDGGGFKVIGLWLDRDDAEDPTQYQGLFGGLGRGTIKNLIVVLDIKGVHGKGMTGGLVGSISSGGVVENCSVIGEGAVTGTGARVGGLAGGNGGNGISGSFATVDVQGVGGVGGLVGYNTTLITGSYATGGVSGTGTSIGGFVGTNASMINTSYATGNVNGASDVGGFVGMNQGSLTNVYATGDAYGNFYIGGLMGGGGGQITNSFASGTATGYHENPYYTGGLQGGGNDYSITNSFYLGNTIDGNNSFGTQVSAEDFLQAAIDAGWDFENIWTNWETGLLPHFTSEVPPAPEPEDLPEPSGQEPEPPAPVNQTPGNQTVIRYAPASLSVEPDSPTSAQTDTPTAPPSSTPPAPAATNTPTPPSEIVPDPPAPLVGSEVVPTKQARTFIEYVIDNPLLIPVGILALALIIGGAAFAYVRFRRNIQDSTKRGS